MTRLTTLSLFCCSVLVPAAALAQKPSTIAGNVYYGSDYNAAKNIPVSIYDSERTLLETQSTSDDGLFRFGGLRRSTYFIVIDIDGYEKVSLGVDVSMASDRGLAIYLKPTSKTPEPSHLNTVSVHELAMPAKARELMDSGMQKLYHDKNAQAALPDLQQAVALAPTYYEASYQLGMAQQSLGDRPKAEKSFRNSFEQSKHTYAEASIGLGGILLDRGDAIEAEQCIRRGLQLNPHLWLGHYELGRALLQQDHLADALSSAEQARQLAPNVPIVYRLLSNIHLKQQDYPALLADLDTYLTLDPSSPAGQRAKQLRDQLQETQSSNHSPAVRNP
jgi:tetratricopeptide (TPR) repeat protein